MPSAFDTTLSEHLLLSLAKEGEMEAQEYLKLVPRVRNDYVDFYPVAGLLHGNYISTDTSTDSGGHTIKGKLGGDMQATSIFLCQLMLTPNESFKIAGCDRRSAHDFQLKIFINADGYLRLDELNKRRIERKRKRNDYLITVAVAILTAVLSSFLTHYFTLQRLPLEHPQNLTNTAGAEPASVER